MKHFHKLPKGGNGANAPMTLRQAAMLGWIAKYIAREGESPTIQEIAKAHDMRASSVWCYLKAMKAKGAIHWPGGFRSVRPVDVAA